MDGLVIVLVQMGWSDGVFWSIVLDGRIGLVWRLTENLEGDGDFGDVSMFENMMADGRWCVIDAW